MWKRTSERQTKLQSPVKQRQESSDHGTGALKGGRKTGLQKSTSKQSCWKCPRFDEIYKFPVRGTSSHFGSDQLRGHHCRQPAEVGSAEQEVLKVAAGTHATEWVTRPEYSPCPHQLTHGAFWGSPSKLNLQRTVQFQVVWFPCLISALRIKVLWTKLQISMIKIRACVCGGGWWWWRDGSTAKRTGGPQVWFPATTQWFTAISSCSGWSDILFWSPQGHMWQTHINTRQSSHIIKASKDIQFKDDNK